MRRAWLPVVLTALTLMSCGESSNDGNSAQADRLKSTRTYNLAGELVKLVEYTNIAPGLDRSDTYEANAGGKLVLVEMSEMETGINEQKNLVVQYVDGREQARQLTTSQFATVGARKVEVRREVDQTEGGQNSTELTEQRYKAYAGGVRLTYERVRRNGIPQSTTEIAFDELGRPLRQTTVDGDAKAQQEITYSWPDGRFKVRKFNEAGKIVGEGEGRNVEKFGAIHIIEQNLQTAVQRVETSCHFVGSTYKCRTLYKDRFSGDLLQAEETSKSLNQDEAFQLVAVSKQRWHDGQRIMQIADTWNYRSDGVFVKQSHIVESSSPQGANLLEQETATPYDFEKSREFNNRDLPSLEVLMAEFAEHSRRTIFEY